MVVLGLVFNFIKGDCMSKNLPLIDIFQNKLIMKKYRKATQDEIEQTNNKIDAIIKGIPIDPVVIENHLQSAIYMAKVSDDNQLEFSIDEILRNSLDFKNWRNHMPSAIPKSIWNYQNRYPNYNMTEMDGEINKIGCKLSVGQTLVHGGLWYDDFDTIITDRPLSATFCPQVALRNAEWRGKAYDNGRIDIMVLTVVNPYTNVYVFRQKGSQKGHEKEVVFASGATLTKIREHFIRQTLAYKWDCQAMNTIEKEVPIYVLEVNIS